MSKTIEAQGTYSIPEGMTNAGDDVSYSFSYRVFEGNTAEEKVQDAIAAIGNEKVASNNQRMEKVDANNLAREKAKSENGHSTRKPLTEEEKSERKAQRSADRELLTILKSKGLSIDDLRKM